MKMNLLDLSEKIDCFTIKIFDTIASVAGLQKIPFFVVGATARDIILEYGYGIDTKRATRDIDLGIQIPDWNHYRKLREALVATGKFSPDKKQAQRLLSYEGFPIDIIPFGAISDDLKYISWPPDQEIKMSTLGYEESYRHSLTVRLRSSPILDVQFASPAGLVIMKLISWNDRYPGRKSDAKDLALLLRTYLEAGNTDRLYDEEADLIGEDFDFELAGARLLGRDVAKILNPETSKAILKILGRETSNQGRYKLVADMTETGENFERNLEDNLRLIEELKGGIFERL